MSTLIERLERGGQARGDLTLIQANSITRSSWDGFLEAARRLSSTFQARDVGRGTRVVVLGQTSSELLTAITAVWLSGAAVVVLPLPARGQDIERFASRTRALAHQVDPVLAIADPAFDGVLKSYDEKSYLLRTTELPTGARSTYSPPAGEPSDLAVLQFTSGSTADPKAVMVTHENLVSNVDAICGAAQLDPRSDRLVSWLPLFHDMGLIGFFALPLIQGIDLVLGDATAFVARPLSWLEWISSFRGTVTGAPNFAYAIAARSLRHVKGLDLSSLRRVFNGAEPINPVTTSEFLRQSEDWGLDPRAMLCGYGMAETTLVAALPAVGAGMRIDTVDRQSLNVGRADPIHANEAGATRLVRLGRPLPGLKLRVVDSHGCAVGERMVGEVQVSGTSVTPGYFNAASETAAAFDGAWLSTGDSGYVAEDDLVVTGRIKDLIIVGGRNVAPTEVEAVIADCEGARPGNVIAFGVAALHASEAVIAVTEARRGASITKLKTQIARVVHAELGLNLHDIAIIEQGTLPKTSSGKLQRSRCRAMYLQGDLERLA